MRTNSRRIAARISIQETWMHEGEITVRGSELRPERFLNQQLQAARFKGGGLSFGMQTKMWLLRQRIKAI